MDQQIYDTDSPLPRVSHTWLIVGSRGAGKSTLALQALTHQFKGFYDNIWLISKTYKNDVLSKKQLRSLVEELEEEGKVHQTIDEDLANDMIEYMEDFNQNFDRKKHKREPRSLILLDDQLSSLPRNMLKSRINDLIVNGRHLRVSGWVLVHKYVSVPLLWRSNAQLISLYGGLNRKENKALEEDLAVEPELLKRLLEFATMGRSFLHINLFDNPPKFYKKFDRIIL